MLKNGLGRLLALAEPSLPVSSHSIRCLTTFQEAKVMHEFNNVFDRNRDGFVCKSDIKDFKRTLDHYHTLKTGQIKRPNQQIDNRYHDFWILFTELADENGDGLISRQEWLNMWKNINERAEGKNIESLPMWVRLLPTAIFPLIDTKEDGHIDFEEFQRFWQHVFGENENKIFNELARHRFDLMTKNGEIPINVKRFEDLYADYYLSEDSSSPGKYIVGATEIIP